MTGRYLLDTNVVSALSRPRAETAVRDWVRALPVDRLFLSEITVGEIAKGIAQHPDERRRAALLAWLDDELLPSFGERLLPVDLRIWRTWGRLAGAGGAKGRPVPILDGLIAATAIERDLIVATRNVRDFERLDVATVDPWRARAS